MKKITARIDPRTGRVTIETEGYEGATCLEATKKLEEGLGLREPERVMKPEYFQENPDNQQVGGA